jgi:hypothetical protein
MDPEYIDAKPDYWLVNEYGIANEELTVDKLTEIYTVCYTIKKRGSDQPEEIYTFTTDFEQALKRFKLLPHKKALLKRFLTDDESLIKLAIDGTKDKVTDTDVDTSIDLKTVLDMYRDEDDDGNAIYETSINKTDADETIIERLDITKD